MNNKIKTFIDRCLIDEYSCGNQTLEISEISKNDVGHFLELLFAEDEGFRDMVEDRMQDMINDRLDHQRDEAMYASGYFPRQDSNNGEIIWSQGIFA